MALAVQLLDVSFMRTALGWDAIVFRFKAQVFGLLVGILLLC